jgi:hypothetical protein
MRSSPGRFRRFRDLLRARRDGKRDGVLGIPTANETALPPALAQIAERAREALAELSHGVASGEARRREHLDGVERDRRTAEIGATTAARTVAVAEQRRQTTQRPDSFTLHAPVDRGPRVGKAVYAVAITSILIAEFPLNAIAFRLFGEAEVLTWVMTASLAVTLVLCAHGLGTFLRQTHPSMAERRWVIVLVALPVLAIIAIALIRARYLAIEEEVTGLDTLGPVVGSAAFLIINLLVYTGATMLSYLAHAPRDHAAEEEAAAEQRVADARRMEAEAVQRLRFHDDRLSKADVESEEALHVIRARADEVIAYHRGLMAAYCKANLRARSNPQVPESMRELPAIGLPSVLRDTPREDRTVTQLPLPLAATGTDR